MKAIISENFLMGIVRVLDLSGMKSWPDIFHENEKDRNALRSDWENVGESIRGEAGSFKKA